MLMMNYLMQDLTFKYKAKPYINPTHNLYLNTKLIWTKYQNTTSNNNNNNNNNNIYLCNFLSGAARYSEGSLIRRFVIPKVR